MMNRRGGTLLTAALALAAAGCSVLLDPDNCSDDSECNGGLCQGGVCVGGGGEPADMGDQGIDGGELPPDAAPDVAVDAAPDMAPPDVEVDMAVDMAPPDPLPPRCMLAAAPDDTAPTTADQVALTPLVTDPDTPLAELTATLNGEAVGLDGEAIMRSLEEGSNRFVLEATDPDGLSCEAEVTVVRDTTGPTLEALTPPDGADLLTADAAFPVSGRVVDAHFDPAGEGRLEVELDGDPVDAEIAWEGAGFAFDVTLEEGRSELRITAVDDLGNRSDPATIAVRLDATAPVVLVDAPVADARIFADRVEVRGRVQDDRQPVPSASYAISIAGDAGQAPVDIDGLADAEGAFTRRVPLFEGENTLTITGQDMAGNTGQVIRRVVRLPADPCVTITGPDDGSFSRVARIDVAGDVCPAVERVEVQVGGGAPIEIDPRAERFQAAVVLPAAGAHEIVATAFAPNGDASDRVTVTFDDTPPTLVISEPAPGQCTNARVLRVCGRVADPESGIGSAGLIVDDEETAVALPPEGGPFCEDVRVREGDDVQIVAQARNRADDPNETTVAVRVDRDAPEVCITRDGACLVGGPRRWFGVDPAGRVEFTGLVDWGVCSVSSLTVQGVAVNVGPDGRFSTARPFADGDQDLAMTVRDTAGNEEEIAFVFRVDGTPPILDAVSPGRDVFTTDGQARLEVEARDTGSGLVSISIGGQEVFRAPAGASEGSRAEIVARVVGLEEGTNTFEVVLVDLVGNRLVETVTIRRDTRPPVLTIESPELGRPAPTPAVVVGTIDDGPEGSGPAAVTVNGVEAVIDAEAGTWRADAVPIDPADPVVFVNAVDALDNILDPPLVLPVVLRDFGTHDPAIDGLDFEGPVGWLGPIDVDLDGLLDLVVLGAQPDVTAQVFRQVAPGRFEADDAADVGLPEGMTVRAAAVADLDENGTHDLVIVGVNRTAVALGNGGGGFVLVENPRVPGSADPTDLALGLTTLNGSLDLLVMAGGGTRFYFGDGTGAFDREPLNTQGLGGLETYRAARFVDLDANGVLDVLALGPDGSTLWMGDAFTAFETIDGARGFVGASARTALAFDADRDGVLDLLTVGPDGGRFMLGDGDGGFVEDDGGILAWPADITALERLDYNGDTRDDLVAAGDVLRLWRNSADGFESIDAVAAGADPGGAAHHVAVTDLDGDGDDDLIVGGPAGLRFIRSNRAATDPGYAFVSVEVLRSPLPPAIGARDGWGATIDVDLAGGDDGDPERTLLARPIGPTIVTIGPRETIDLSVRYIDRGEIGGNVRDEPGLLSRTFTEIFGRE